MNDSKVTVSQDDTGKIKVNIPVSSPTPNDPVSVSIDPGTKEHTVVVGSEHPTHPERRKNPPPTQVIMQAPAGGLQGKAATIANMSAVGFVMVMMFLIYSDFRANVKEQNGYIRDEMRHSSETQDRNMNSLNLAITQLATSNNAVITELRSGRLAMDAKLEKIMMNTEKKTKP